MYGVVHGHFEALLFEAKNGNVAPKTPMALAQKYITLFEEWGYNPRGTARSEQEATERDAIADAILNKYPRDTSTGDYKGVKTEDAFLVRALYASITEQVDEPRLSDAFDFYLKEKKKADPTKRKLQEQAIARVRKIALTTLKEDKKLSEITRDDARKIRDALLATGVKTATVQRRLKTLSAVYTFVAREFDLDPRSPFSALTMPDPGTVNRETRDPLPQPVIEAMYERLARASKRRTVRFVSDRTPMSIVILWARAMASAAWTVQMAMTIASRS